MTAAESLPAPSRRADPYLTGTVLSGESVTEDDLKEEQIARKALYGEWTKMTEQVIQFVNDANLGKRFREAVAGTTMLVVHHFTPGEWFGDNEDDTTDRTRNHIDGESHFRLEVFPRAGHPHRRLTQHAEDLLQCFVQLFGGEATKRCSTCKEIKAFSEFSYDARDHRTGRNGRCKKCERERVAKHKAVKHPKVYGVDRPKPDKVPMKRCKGLCQRSRPVTYFCKDKAQPDGLTRVCRLCLKKVRLAKKKSRPTQDRARQERPEREQDTDPKE